MPTQKATVIAVIGGKKPSKKEATLAEEVGKEIASRGAVLVCGGLGGVMEAACRGAQSAGGLTIGILPGGDRKAANRYVQVPIVTNMGYARNVIVVRSAQAVIAIGGGYGTLSEIAYALDAGIPVIGINTWALSRLGKPDCSIVTVRTAKQAVQKAMESMRSTE